MAFKQQNIPSHRLEAGGLRGECRCAGQVSASWSQTSHYVPNDRRTRELCGFSLMRMRILFRTAPAAWPSSHLPKAPPPNSITLGVRGHHMNFRGHRYSDHSTHRYSYNLSVCAVFSILSVCWYFPNHPNATWSVLSFLLPHPRPPSPTVGDRALITSIP